MTDSFFPAFFQTTPALRAWGLVLGVRRTLSVLCCALVLGGCASQAYKTEAIVEPKETLATLCVLNPAPGDRFKVFSELNGWLSFREEGPRSDVAYEVQSAQVAYEVGFAPALTEKLQGRGVVVKACSAQQSPAEPRLVTDMVTVKLTRTYARQWITFVMVTRLYLPGVSDPAWVGRFLTGDPEFESVGEHVLHVQAFADNVLRELERSGWVRKAQ